jgi:type IV pilus assembly protein PilV
MFFNGVCNMKLENISAPKAGQKGATLIEALVSILILSLGLLGMAALQLNALSFQKSSAATHRIAELTNDISEKIRANPTAAKDGDYVYTATYTSAKSATMTSNLCRTSGVDCTTTNIANDDIRAWLMKSQTALPGGAVRLEGDVNNGFNITVMYQDKDFVDTSTGVAQSSVSCTSATSGIAWRNCCPAAAAVTGGVRCYRTNLIP